MNADGSGPTRLTNNAAADVEPAWSPDGSRIAFASTRDGNFEIYVMNADGSNQTRLTNNAAADDQPAWSPDGTRIAFKSNRDGIERDLRHERQRHRPDPAHQQRGERLRSRLVARRHPDRLCEQPRRQLRDLRHERQRLGPDPAHHQPPGAGRRTRLVARRQPDRVYHS